MSFLWHGLTEQGAQVPVQVDAQGRVIAVDGTPGVSNWDRTNGVLSPAVPGDSVDIGSGNISLKASGSATFAKDIEAQKFTSEDAAVTGFTAITDNASGSIKKFASYNIDTLSEPFFVTGDGSATFAGTVKISDFDPSGETTSGIELRQSGEIMVQREKALPTSSIFDGRLGKDQTVSITAGGSATFAGLVTGKGSINSIRTGGTETVFVGTLGSTNTSHIYADGSATFAGDITAANVTFRSADPQFYVKKSKNKDALPEYVGPELDLLAEIARLESLVRHLYETLRLTPPAGWPVWDGNDDVLRQIRQK